MSHYAEIDPITKIVKRVIVAEQNFIDSGAVGNPNNWIQTSFNTHHGKHIDPITKNINTKPPLRKNFAGVGFTYDKQRDAFIPPKPYNSWVLNENTCTYDPPIPIPNDNKYSYNWNETTKNWDKIEFPKIDDN